MKTEEEKRERLKAQSKKRIAKYRKTDKYKKKRSEYAKKNRLLVSFKEKRKRHYRKHRKAILEKSRRNYIKSKREIIKNHAKYIASMEPSARRAMCKKYRIRQQQKITELELSLLQLLLSSADSGQPTRPPTN